MYCELLFSFSSDINKYLGIAGTPVFIVELSTIAKI